MTFFNNYITFNICVAHQDKASPQITQLTQSAYKSPTVGHKLHFPRGLNTDWKLQTHH